MEIINDLEDLKLNNTAITIGKFDGLHRGHKKLMGVLSENAEDLSKVVMSFSSRPIDFINHTEGKTIVTGEEKKILCEKEGMDYYVELPLNEDFLNMSYEDFVSEFLIKKFGMKLFVCGEDFTFGRKGAGNVKKLSELSEKYGFKLIVVKKKQEEHRDICSSDIKVLLSEGNISKVNKLLGYPYFAIGRVEHGKKLGRTIGFPTANLFVEGNKLLPPNGVYATVLKADGKEYRAVTNIGFNPTTDDDGKIKIETYAIDVGLDLYDRIIEIAFLGFIRTERKFESLSELVEQMKRDVEVRKKLK